MKPLCAEFYFPLCLAETETNILLITPLRLEDAASFLHSSGMIYL